MIKRKMMDFLINWKLNKNEECLLVKGARQVGKTFIIDRFGKDNYESYIYINFLKNPEFKAIFSGSLSAEEIYKNVSLFLLDVRFVKNNTLIFLDEIQECPEARTALKFLAIDNQYDVIASGSLLGINYKEVPSIPVGYELQIEMHSLDFEEFLWALGMSEKSLVYVKEYFENLKQVPLATHNQMMKYLREYIVVGGMPAVVSKYIDTLNFGEVHKVQEKILTSYLDDIASYAPMSEKPKARNCFLSVPKQLAKEYKKFQFSVVEKGASARKYSNSLEWLRDANVIRFCFNVITPQFPLAAYEREDQYKIYLNDIGLLVAMYGFEIKRTIIDNSIKGNAKGGIYENLIADILIKKDKKLYYYKKEDSTQEIEFIISKDGHLIPIEVKASNGHSISLNNILDRVDIKYGYKLISGNIGIKDKKITMPLYMAMFL